MADPPPRPPRGRSQTLDEQIRRRQEQEEAEREAARLHPAYESSEPPPILSAYPPVRQARPGEGNPSVMAPPRKNVDATHKAFVSVWGIIVILVAAAGGGWAAHAFLPTGAKIEALEQKVEKLEKLQATNQESIQVTFAGIKTDIEWLKKEQQAKQPEPLKPPGGRR